MGRYDRNIGTITIEEQALLAKKSVCVVGCGGLGGGIIENLVRMGVGKMTVVDGDVFDESNLNRQVLSHEGNIGKSKAVEAMEQMKRINSEVQVTPVCALIDETNAYEIISGHDIVVDALDNVKARLILEDACDNEGIPMVHGAINGWNGQVAVVMPGSKIMNMLYAENESEAEEADMSNTEQGTKSGKCEETSSNPSFTPAVVAGLQAAETVKVLLGRKEVLKSRLLMIDLLYHEYEIIDFE